MSTTSATHGVVVEEATPEQARAVFDARCQALLGVSGAVFLERLRSGAPWDDEQEPAVAELALMVPFAGR